MKHSTRNKRVKRSLYGRRKTIKNNIHGRIIGKENGWIKVLVYGTHYEMGYANGRLLAKEFIKCLEILDYLIGLDYGISYAIYKQKCEELLGEIVKRDFPEIYEEMKGISDGASRMKKVDFGDVLAWNAYLSMTEILGETRQKQRQKDAQNGHSPVNDTIQRCSAFIATGNATERGDIIMAHNTHCHYALGSVSNVILYASPQTGYSFVMQTCAGLVCSTMDWFICSSGIVGCETTIAGMQYTPEFGAPYFCRIRRCMQYGNNLDEYAEIMTAKNAGDYSCSWLFGDVNSGEIMLCELGKKETNIQKTDNGVYYGMNSPIDYEIRALETDILDTKNEVSSVNARRERLEYLLLDKYAGRINVQNAKKVIADHYDGFLGKTQMSSRTICKHGEHDGTTHYMKYFPVGAVDGKVLNSHLAKNMSFWGRFGSSCGRTFNAKKYKKEHKEWGTKYLTNFPNYDWEIISP